MHRNFFTLFTLATLSLQTSNADSATCLSLKNTYQLNSCCGNPSKVVADTCKDIHFNSVQAKVIHSGGFKPNLEAKLDEFMMNGKLLNKFPTDAKNSSYSSAAFMSVSVQKGGEQFHKTWGVDSKTKEPYAADAEVPSLFYSSTKMVANLLGLYFWEKNVIDLDEPVWKYLPEYHTDSDVTNKDSVYPLHVLRPILATDTIVGDKVRTVEGEEYPLKKHTLSENIGETNAGKVFQYYEQPVALNDYPTMRQFMTHTDGSLGYNAFGSALFSYDLSIPGVHILGTDLEMQACGADYSASGFYGPFFNCDLANNTLASGVAAHAKFGKVIFYPGRASHYSWSNAVVGRLVEVAYQMMSGHTKRFEDIAEEVLFSKIGATKSRFYVLESDPMFEYYKNNYASGVSTTATASSSMNAHNWEVVAESELGGRYTFSKGVVRALGDAGMYTTAKDYMKMMNVALTGLAPDGYTRILRASTARMLSKHMLSHVFDDDEYRRSNKVIRVLPTLRTLGGAITPQRYLPDSLSSDYDEVFAWRDKDKSVDLEGGVTTVSWGGAAGTVWFINHEDDYLYSMQTNVVVSGDVQYLARKMSQLILDHSF